MNRSSSGRAAGALVVALGLLLGMFASNASAQVALAEPGAQIQLSRANSGSTDGVASTAAGVGEAGTMAERCGWYVKGDGTSMYKHCGWSSHTAGTVIRPPG